MALSKIEANSLDIGQVGGRRNLIINGAMQVAQRGTSFTGVGNGDNAYHLDRFKFAESGSPNGEFTITQASDGPSGFSNSLKLDCTTAETALASNEAIRLIYNFEGQDLQHLKKGTSDAEYVTLSFYVKSNLTGTAVVGLYDNDNTRYNAKTYTIDSANTWERKVLTFQPDTTGTLDDDNALSLQIYFWLQAGSNKTSGTLPSNWESNTEANQAPGQTINIASSADNDFFITGVQLEVGDTATPFEHRSYGEELQLCQRYYYRWAYDNDSEGILDGTGYNTNEFFGTLQHPVVMRGRPAGSDGGGANAFNLSGNNGNVYVNSTSLSYSEESPRSIRLNVTGISGSVTTGYSYWLRFGTDSSAFIEMDAEL